MNEGALGHSQPLEILGRRVVEICPECNGEGRLWAFNDKTHWAVRCERCNCIGYILDMPNDYPEMDPDDIPF